MNLLCGNIFGLTHPRELTYLEDEHIRTIKKYLPIGAQTRLVRAIQDIKEKERMETVALKTAIDSSMKALEASENESIRHTGGQNVPAQASTEVGVTPEMAEWVKVKGCLKLSSVKQAEILSLLCGDTYGLTDPSELVSLKSEHIADINTILPVAAQGRFLLAVNKVRSMKIQDEDGLNGIVQTVKIGDLGIRDNEILPPPPPQSRFASQGTGSLREDTNLNQSQVPPKMWRSSV
uniref:Uncharacterized protein n=1 Tax=Octactis speculum TaxID=3111310 RepID=A0A7S2MN62_9STRA